MGILLKIIPKEYRKVMEEAKAEKALQMAQLAKDAAQDDESPEIVEGVDLYREDIMQDTPAHTIEPVVLVFPLCFNCNFCDQKRICLKIQVEEPVNEDSSGSEEGYESTHSDKVKKRDAAAGSSKKNLLMSSSTSLVDIENLVADKLKKKEPNHLDKTRLLEFVLIENKFKRFKPRWSCFQEVSSSTNDKRWSIVTQMNGCRTGTRFTTTKRFGAT